MQIFKFCFQCPAQFSELLPESLATDEMFIEDLISQILKSFPLLVIVDGVKLRFSPEKNEYTVQMRVYYYDHFDQFPDEVEDTESQIEALISHALLQLFWVVSVDNSDCWPQI